MVRVSYYESSYKWKNTTVVQSNYLFVGTYLDFSKPFARFREPGNFTNIDSPTW